MHVRHCLNLLGIALTIAIAYPAPSRAQSPPTATLTVLRGTVLVERGDGSVLDPAPSGLTLSLGDRITSRESAIGLITIADVSEIQLSASSTVALRALALQDGRPQAVVEQVAGVTVHSVQSPSEFDGSYRVLSERTVVRARGAVFSVRTDPATGTTVALEQCGARARPQPPGECLEFPAQGFPMRPGDRRTFTTRDTLVSDSFGLGAPLFDVVSGPASGPEIRFSPQVSSDGRETGSAQSPTPTPALPQTVSSWVTTEELPHDADVGAACAPSPEGQAQILASRVTAGRAMPLREILGHVRYCAVPMHEFRFERFGVVRRAIFMGTPIGPHSVETSDRTGPGSLGYVIESFVIDGSGQFVQITWRVQFDGDYFHWYDARIIPREPTVP